MRVPMTITTTSGGQREVVVEAHGVYDGRALTEALVQALDLGRSSSMWAGNEMIGSDHRLGLPPLVAGASLTARSRPPLPEPHRRAGTSPLRLAVTAGRDAGQELDLRHGTYTVGRGAGCDLVLDDPAVSRAHAIVSSDEHGVHVRDLDVTNPSTIDDAEVPSGGCQILAGEVLTIGGHRLELVGPSHRALPTTPRGDGTLSVSPAPIPAPPPADSVIMFPPPPAPARPRRFPWIMLLMPLPVAGALAVVLGPRMLLFALFSPVMILGSSLSERFGSRADRRHEEQSWARATRAARQRLDDALAHERRARLHAHPGPYEVRRTALLPTARLWERRDDRGRPVRLRVGLGDVRAETRARLGGGSPDAVLLREAPVVLDLDEHPVIGVVGDPSDTRRTARWLVGQALAMHPPGELVVLMLGEPSWMEGLRHAPHVRPVDLAGLPEIDRGTRGAPVPPMVLVVTEEPARWRDDVRWRALLTAGAGGSTRVLMASTIRHSLPHECRTTIEHDGNRAVVRSGTVTTPTTADGVDHAWADEVGRALAPLRDATPGGVSTLPLRVSLATLLQSTAGRSEADTSRAPEGLAAVIGTSGEGPFSIDLVADGPHALVGGTTGSGKSELLQTWVASLAHRHGPDRLSFILVDYKGGAAFAGCARLPHTVGVLTDLDPAGTRRALRSLQAEVRRREKLLAARGCSDIDTFRSRGGELPRLVVVIDEFRALAEEQPDALKELVHLAAVGRSLGLHLVLATQRPSGVITPEIRANVNLRIALRVRDRSDSEDIIGSVEAASLPEGTPGRALLRTGSEPPTSFQTAYVGGRTRVARSLVVHTDDPTSSHAPPAERGPTDLDIVVADAHQAWVRSGAPAPHRPWQPPLPAETVEDQLPPTPPGRVAWGLVDQPDKQRWEALSWAPEDGHQLILGGSGTGRTTAACSLATRAANHLPTGARVHALVPPGPLADRLSRAPGVESVLDPGDPSATRRLLARTRRETDERRDRLRASGYATFEQWERSRTPDEPAPPPPLLLLVDSWSHLAAGHDGSAHETAHEIEALARDGLSVGVRLVVTGGRDLATSRLAALVGRRLVLHLPDRHDALAAGLRPDDLVVGPVPGRGVLLPDRSLAQVAPVPSPDRPATTRSMGREGPWRIVELPRRVHLSELRASCGGRGDGEPTGAMLGHSGEAGLPVTLPLDADGTWCVVGPRRSGRTTALHVVAEQLRDAGRRLVQVTTHPEQVLPGDHPVLGPDDVDALVAQVRRYDDPVVLVDDIETLDGSPLHEALRALVDHCSRAGGLLLAATTNEPATGVRGLAPLACRARQGLLLQPRQRTDGDALGVRVPPSERVPGRGYLVDHGEATEVQVALPDEPLVGVA